jgi:hypothetical protein
MVNDWGGWSFSSFPWHSQKGEMVIKGRFFFQWSDKPPPFPSIYAVTGTDGYFCSMNVNFFKHYGRRIGDGFLSFSMLVTWRFLLTRFSPPNSNDSEIGCCV